MQQPNVKIEPIVGWQRVKGGMKQTQTRMDRVLILETVLTPGGQVEERWRQAGVCARRVGAHFSATAKGLSESELGDIKLALMERDAAMDGNTSLMDKYERKMTEAGIFEDENTEGEHDDE